MSDNTAFVIAIIAILAYSAFMAYIDVLAK
jgi:hypothetical protein